MNIIVSTSRGKAIKPHFKYMASQMKLSYSFEILPGASLDRITHHTTEILESIHSQPTTIIVIAGLPDFTEKLIDKSLHYEEVVFRKDPDLTRELYMRKVQRLTDIAHSHNAKIGFATIVPANISMWNHTRLRQSKTRLLKYEEQ